MISQILMRTFGGGKGTLPVTIRHVGQKRCR